MLEGRSPIIGIVCDAKDLSYRLTAYFTLGDTAFHRYNGACKIHLLGN